MLCLVIQSCLTLLRSHGMQPARLLCPLEFSRQKYWSGLPFPSPGDLPNSGIKSRSPTLQADCLPTATQGSPVEMLCDFPISVAFHWQLYVPNHYYFFFCSQKLQSMFWFKKPNSLATLLFFCQSLNVNDLGSLTGAYPLLILPFSFSDA